MWSYVWKRCNLRSRVVLNQRLLRHLLQRNKIHSAARSPSSPFRMRSTRARHASHVSSRPGNFKLTSPSRRAFSNFSASKTLENFNKTLKTSKTNKLVLNKNFAKRQQSFAAAGASFCIGISAFLVMQSLESVRLQVPTREEADLHASEDFASIKNAQFVHGTYDQIIEEFIPKFSDTDREIVKNLDLILSGCDGYESNFWRGRTVCEIGSGTGTLAFPIISRIGEEASAGGGYIGLDISSAFVHYLDREFEKRGLLRTRALAGKNTPQSLCLPDELKGKIDIFVICDTFYHLDDSAKTVKEIRTFLKPGGKLVLIENKSEEELTTQELEKGGFRLGYQVTSEKFESQFVNIYKKV